MVTRTVRRYVIALSVVVLVVVLYAVAGFWAVPHFLRSGLNDFVSTHYKRQLTLGEIRFNPFTFKLDVNDFSLPDSDGQPMLGFGLLHVDLEVKSLFKLGPSFREIVLDRPLIRTVVRRDGTLNLADLGKGFPPAPANAPPPKPSEPMRLFIDRFAVLGGGGTFEDLSHATPFRAEFKPIAFELRNFSTRAKKDAHDDNEYSLNAASPQGERLTWNGTILLEPLSSHGTFEVADLQASTIWSYLQQPLPMEIPSGVIAVKGEYNFDTAGAAPSITVDVHDTIVSDLKLRPAHGATDYVVLGKLDVQETQVDVGKRAVQIGKISLTGGEVNAWLSAQGQLNLLELTTPAGGRAAASQASNGATSAAANAPVSPGSAGAGAAGPSAASAGVTPAWSISAPDISVTGFKVAAEDRQLTPALAVVLRPLDIHVAGYNTSPSARLDVTANTSINDSATLKATAQLPSNASEVTAHIDLAQLDLTMFQPVIAQRTAMTLRSGRLATQLDIKKGGDGNISVKGDVGVTGLRSVDELQQSFIKWKDLRVAGMQYNLQPASLRIDSITAREPYARVIIAPDRTVNVEEVLAGPSKGTPSLATQLGAARAAGGQVSVAKVQAENAAAKGANANAKAASATAAAAAAGAKAASAKADAVASSAKAAASDAKAAVANANAAAAEATAKLADATAAAAVGKGPDTAKGAVGGGSTAAGDVGKGANANEGADAGGTNTAAGTSNANTATGDDSEKSRKDKRKRKFKPTGVETAPAPPPHEPIMPVSIGTIRIIDGSANYADFWIQPNFAVGIQTLNGSINGLSSEPSSRAKVKLDGKVDRYAPVNIDGEMNLLAATVYSDIKMSFKGLELTTMTPYSGRFAGYKIDKGKLSVDLNYKIDQRKLTAEQRFVIDQLQLGEQVDSPDAVHLPLKLAVALLKDRNGVIDVPLPISGSLDDPQFKIGPIIWHAVVNLFVKVATAPFAALGRLFGGHGEEMKYIDFDPGSAELDDASREKLNSLTKALQDKTQLQLDVPIVFSKDLDVPELAKRRLNQRLVARARSGKSPKQQVTSAKEAGGKAAAGSKGASGGQGGADSSAASGGNASGGQSGSSSVQTAAPSADAARDPALADPLQHYRLLLAEFEADVGKDAQLPPTAQAIQSAKNKKDAPPVETAIPELEQAIIPHIDIPDITLQDLGKKRTRAIQDVLLANGGIDASRVFIINGPAKADQDGKVRVEMSLK
jgi:hypothetical protein